MNGTPPGVAMLVLRSAPPRRSAARSGSRSPCSDLGERVAIEVADISDPNETLRSQNPLGKIPTLLLDSGEALYDSRVIVEYLDALAGGGRLIPTGWARF